MMSGNRLTYYKDRSAVEERADIAEMDGRVRALLNSFAHHRSTRRKAEIRKF